MRMHELQLEAKLCGGDEEVRVLNWYSWVFSSISNEAIDAWKQSDAFLCDCLKYLSSHFCDIPISTLAILYSYHDVILKDNATQHDYYDLSYVERSYILPPMNVLVNVSQT